MPNTRALLAVSLLNYFFFATPSWAETFYVSDGTGLRATDGDPNVVQVEQWAACYYKSGMTVRSTNNCSGMELGKTAESVIRKVKNAQKFERMYTKWCGCAWDLDSAFNVVVPIAMLKRQQHVTHQEEVALHEAHELGEKLEQAIEKFNAVVELNNGEDHYEVPRGPLAEFMKRMHDTIKQSLAVGSAVSNYADSGIFVLESELNQYSASVSQVQTLLPSVTEAANPSSGIGNMSWKLDSYWNPTHTSINGGVLTEIAAPDRDGDGGGHVSFRLSDVYLAPTNHDDLIIGVRCKEGRAPCMDDNLRSDIEVRGLYTNIHFPSAEAGRKFRAAFNRSVSLTGRSANVESQPPRQDPNGSQPSNVVSVTRKADGTEVVTVRSLRLRDPKEIEDQLEKKPPTNQ